MSGVRSQKVEGRIADPPTMDNGTTDKACRCNPLDPNAYDIPSAVQLLDQRSSGQ